VISRRWVLQLGAGTVLSGFHGWAEEQSAPLPPGVYGPSLNHLGHALQAANARPLAEYRPRFFDAREYALIQRVFRVFLGDVSGDTIREIANWADLTLANSLAVRDAARALSPAERALAVAYYGTAPVQALESDDSVRVMRDGLRSLIGVETDSALAEALQEGTPFYNLARRAAIDGYYTSREGLKDLNYKGNAMYAESPGCAHPIHF